VAIKVPSGTTGGRPHVACGAFARMRDFAPPLEQGPSVRQRGRG
jgi:hypothetical protein